MSQAIRESFMKISSLFEEQDAATTDIPFVEYPGTYNKLANLYNEISE